ATGPKGQRSAIAGKLQFLRNKPRRLPKRNFHDAGENSSTLNDTTPESSDSTEQQQTLTPEIQEQTAKVKELAEHVQSHLLEEKLYKKQTERLDNNFLIVARARRTAALRHWPIINNWYGGYYEDKQWINELRRINNPKRKRRTRYQLAQQFWDLGDYEARYGILDHLKNKRIFKSLKEEREKEFEIATDNPWRLMSWELQGTRKERDERMPDSHNADHGTWWSLDKATSGISRYNYSV
ncbi:hypothetical protein MMC20_006206, partial [Loxospora ochrophaea]|nr:hypothetical protein [Loxospora ochrophaea]